MPHDKIGSAYLEDALRNLRSYKKLGDEAMAQVSDLDLFRLIDPEANSIAIIVKHMAGNMRSRWTNFLSSDGEKADRHRDQEFVLDGNTTRTQMIDWWNTGWNYALEAISALEGDDLLRNVTIAGRPLSVMQAINRQLLHYAGHVNQIVLLAKHFAGTNWKSLSIPKGQSEAYRQKAEERFAKRSQG